MASRRLRNRVQTRDLYARAPLNDMRVNSPDGHMVLERPLNNDPIRWSAAFPVKMGGGGGWFVSGDDDRFAPGGGDNPVGAWHGMWPGDGSYAPRYPTHGSKLTEPRDEDRAALHHAGMEGMVLPAVTRCTTVLSEAVVRTRWLYTDSQGQVMPRPLWIDDPMGLGSLPGPIFPLQALGKRMGGHAFFVNLFSDALLFGQGGFVYQPAADGQPLAGSCIPLNPLMFHKDKSGHVMLNRFSKKPLRTGFDGEFQMNGQEWRVAVLQGPYPNHDLWPEGVLLKHFHTMRLGINVQGYLNGLFFDGIPSGYLQTTVGNFGVEVPDPDFPGEMINEADLLKRRWMEANGRSRASVAVMNSTVSYVPISVSPLDAEAEKVARISRSDIALAFGMDPIWVGEGASGLTYSNASERRADLVSMTAAGLGERMTDFITSLMPYGSRASIYWPSFISPSIETLSPNVVQLVQAGVITGPEARSMLGLTEWMGPDPDYKDTTKASGYQAPVPPALQQFQGGQDGNAQPE